MTSEAAAWSALQVGTPDGQATLSVVWCDRDTELRPAETHGLNHYPALRGTRMLLRSAAAGMPDAFVVVERFTGSGHWRCWEHATTEMTEGEAMVWQRHQRPLSARPHAGALVAAWLDRQLTA